MCVCVCVCLRVVGVLWQSWNEHFFVLSANHLYYTEEQQEEATDATDRDDAPSDDEEEVGHEAPRCCSCRFAQSSLIRGLTTSCTICRHCLLSSADLSRQCPFSPVRS